MGDQVADWLGSYTKGPLLRCCGSGNDEAAESRVVLMTAAAAGGAAAAAIIISHFFLWFRGEFKAQAPHSRAPYCF